jgi:hypothetical protein
MTQSQGTYRKLEVTAGTANKHSSNSKLSLQGDAQPQYSGNLKTGFRCHYSPAPAHVYLII